MTETFRWMILSPQSSVLSPQSSVLSPQSLSFVLSHHLRLPDRVPLHRLFQIGFRRCRRKVQGRVQRVEFEKIAMLAARRTRSAITIFPESILAGDALRRFSFGDCGRIRGDVPNDPMVERAARRVGIIDDQRETLGV